MSAIEYKVIVNKEITKTGVITKTSWYYKDKLHRIGGPAITYDDGNEYWYEYGRLHREDGPAHLNDLGTKYWYQHGLLHRGNGPAIEWKDGAKYWYQYGQLHREDGPARCNSDNDVQYWLYNALFPKENWEEIVKELQEKRLFIKLKGSL